VLFGASLLADDRRDLGGEQFDRVADYLRRQAAEVGLTEEPVSAPRSPRSARILSMTSCELPTISAPDGPAICWKSPGPGLWGARSLLGL